MEISAATITAAAALVSVVDKRISGFRSGGFAPHT